MEKVLVLSCTNRPDSNTLKVSRIYLDLLKKRGVEGELLDFRTLPHDIAFSETFGSRTPEFQKFVEHYIRPFRRFIFVVPEYNGSFPGILKVFIDSTHPREWSDKDACIVGVSDGRAGNLRGMEHLTGILNYLKMHVYHDRLPISVINTMLTPGGEFSSAAQLKASEAQVDGFLRF
jgi:chromate reductase, NAD(P)H dehydrogenase (quinone)